MAPADADLQADHEAAFTGGEVALYDHDERACYVSEDASFDDVPRALVAQLAHALDAQHFSIAESEPNADAEFARRAVGLEGQAGSLVKGSWADLAVIDADNINHWLYHFRPNACTAVMKAGHWAIFPS